MAVVGGSFTATWSTKCARCGDAIEPGDEAAYVDGKVCCECCADDVRAENRGF